LVLDEQNPKRVVYYEKLKAVDFGRIREVMEGPDGFIYFTTSNRDGRGTPTSEDDRIFRIRFE
ncbi:MAG: PQQ-dependent sugar dehydrogenase, partial [Candidatus Moranbacteria bacterium]|nr:PQQ-dependent sugar dehydrogenase [Candidatus Moranbacteria bacterium]